MTSSPTKWLVRVIWPHLSPRGGLVLHKTASRLHGPFRLSEFELRRVTPGMQRARPLVRPSLRSQCNSLHVGHMPSSSQDCERSGAFTPILDHSFGNVNGRSPNFVSR